MSQPDKRPLVAEIKRNSLDDGPGIRSVVFFKGCPLQCVWCHNPECMRPDAEILYRQAKCMGCGSCAAVCRDSALGPNGPASLDREACTLCGACADECPTGALSAIGTAYTPLELAGLLARDKAFYDNSGGGVTLSGGEPTLFLDCAAELAEILQSQGIRVLVETCGDFPWDSFEKKLLPHIDQVFVDMKFCDAALHRRFTGRDNERIKRNILKLVRLSSVDTLVRVPLVPGLTATRENLEAIAGWMRAAGIGRIALLPYNPLWIPKAQGLGRAPDYRRETWMSPDEREAVKKIFEGFEITREI
jgi:pyruvate formate lyase activating enzyme